MQEKKINKVSFCFVCAFLLNVSLYGQIVIKNSDHAVNIALQNSDELVLQGLSSLSGMKLAKMSFRDFLPSIDFSMSNTQSVTEYGSDNKSKSFSLSATQVLYDGGQRLLAYKLNNISSLYAYDEYEQSLKSFSSEIINQYYSLLKQVKIVKIKKDLLETADAQLAIIQRELELGLALETNYLEYLISYLDTKNDFELSERELERKKDSFKVSLGLEKSVDIDFAESFTAEDTYKPLIGYKDFLYERIKLENIELKKQNLELMASQAQIDYKKHWYFPSVSLESSVSFSGKNYPLTQPDYSFKLSFGFANNPVAPVEYGKKVGIKKNKVTSIGDTVSANILPSSTFVLEDKQEKINQLRLKLQNEQTKNQLYERLLDSIYNHDDSVHEIEMKAKSIALQKKKIEVSEVELKNGSLKRVDYLGSLIKLASSEIELLEDIVNVGMLERNLEIAAKIPFGEITHVCEDQKK